MASGPEHYAEAERLLDLAQLGPDEYVDGTASIAAIAATAQAHATLALAAAAAEGYAAGLVRRPTPPDVFGGPDPGTPWGAVLYPLVVTDEPA